MRDYQSAILMDANYGLAYYNSANVLLLHRQYGQALSFLNIAIDKCELRDESTYQNRAIVKAFMNDAAGAFRDLCEAIKFDRFSAHIYLNRGLLLFKLENYELAEKDLTTGNKSNFYSSISSDPFGLIDICIFNY
jgi:tetratricopeptide (TPR) repeat protein